ncbi:MAG: putative Ig domain-containing protein [Bacteroidota bacterium]|nr:putative Ig domain-containing protein [Bacteroidota bacterium]
MKKLGLLFCTIMCAITVNAQEILLYNGWKFQKGDDMAWAAPTFDDSKWKPIEVNRTWESQGYEGQDGYGWYRIKIMIPSTLKQNSFYKDSLKFLLGFIDDHDQLYLNGELLAQNAYKTFQFGTNNNTPGGSAYNIERRYAISTNHKAIQWDKENVIAIRVYDQLGEGGMKSGARYSLSMVDVLDYVSIDADKVPFTFSRDSKLSKTIILNSSAPVNTKMEGYLSIDINDNISQKTLATYKVFASFDSNNPFEFEFKTPTYENATAQYGFTHAATGNMFTNKQEVPFLLTPFEKEEPIINNASTFGARPGNPVLYTIAASGIRPVTFKADNLPEGLTLDTKTGQISGKVAKLGTYSIKLTAQNSKGTAQKEVKFIIGDKINLTPQMGWNSWNCWGLAVSDDKVRSSAKAMVDKGLINYGWSYVNIDDGWEDKRDANGVLQPNSKFPDMKKLADDIHGMGLKIGIYSSPGPKTCGGYEGSYKFEQKDIETWAAWGIDYLKYDWCSYTDVSGIKMGPAWTVKMDKSTLDKLIKPYALMQKYIEKAPRDMTYSLCQYGWGDVWKWGASVNGQSWRTTGDIEDSWNSLYSIGFSQAPLAQYAQPGRWNDPDMLIVGKVGWGPKLRNSRLTVNEQYTHISLWAMLASPLLIGCDMAQLDEFTLNLLKNAEVIAINQDALGKQAQRLIKNDDYEVYVKDLEDGSKAVCIFNISQNVKKISVNLNDLKIIGSKKIHDIWRQKDVANSDKIEATLASHGCYLVKVN